MSAGPTAVLSRNAGVEALDTDFTVVDVETTGLAAATERVIEVAAIRVRGGTTIDEFATLVNPCRPIDNTEYHGITSAHVADAPTWAQIAPVLQSYLSGSVMVCHNSVFDHAFLAHEFERVGVDISGVPTLCTLVSSRAQLDLWGYKLRTVVGRVTGVWPDYEHTALDDARTTVRLLNGLLVDGAHPLRLAAPAPVSWSHVTVPTVLAKHRVAAVQRDLVHLVHQLPITSREQIVNGPALDHYRAVLNRAMEDRKIDLDEAEELAESIRFGGLTRDAVEGVHRELLDQHRSEAHADGIVTWDEATSLSKIARLVGMPEYVAEEEHLGRQDKATRQALVDWRVVGVGLDDDVAEVLDLAADHAASTGTSITARTSVVVVSDADRELPRVRRAENLGKLVMSPPEARRYLLDVVGAAVPAEKANQPSARREPVVRWEEHWRPYELRAEDCVGWFHEEARARALKRARPSASSMAPRTVPARTIEIETEADEEHLEPHLMIVHEAAQSAVRPSDSITVASDELDTAAVAQVAAEVVVPSVPDSVVFDEHTPSLEAPGQGPLAQPHLDLAAPESIVTATSAHPPVAAVASAERGGLPKSPKVSGPQQGADPWPRAEAPHVRVATTMLTPRADQRPVGVALVSLGAISFAFATLMSLALIAAIAQGKVLAAIVLVLAVVLGAYIGWKLVCAGRGRYRSS